MNTSTPTIFAQSSGFAGRVVSRLRQWIWGVGASTQQPTAGLIYTDVEGRMTLVAHRIQAISASGRQSAGHFGRVADPVTVVRISVSNRLVGKPKTGPGQMRPGLAHAAGKTSNRVAIIR